MLTVGTVIRSRYRIIQLLGSGGFCETYLAEDSDIPTNPKPKCVVKHLRPPHPSPAVVEIAQNLFNREAEVLHRLGNIHNQIPKLYAHFQEHNEFYLVQEFIDGHDLTTEIPRGKQLSETEVIKLLQEILEVLTIVHQQNIIHRDIKPQNIMRRHQDSKIILIDFGAVKEIKNLTINQGQVNSTIVIGTPGYMPTEQANSKPRLASDIYAVGMLGIQALTGIRPQQLPEDPTSGEIIWRNWANVSDQFADVLTKMVRYHFNERYQSAAEALQVLNSLPPLKPVSISKSISKPKIIPQPAPSLSQRRVISRRRAIKTLGFIGAGIGLAIAAERFLRTSPPEKSPTSRFTPSTSEPSTESPRIVTTPVSPTPQQTSTSPIPPLKTSQIAVVTIDARGNITNRRNHQTSYFTEDLGNDVSLEMVEIPSGTFVMGSPLGEVQRDSDEGPQRQVTVPRFFMGKYEVTQAQYQAIMGNNPSNFKGAKRPVETVSWHDAVEFCEKLSKKTGRIYRLPSEAEWEYACRAGTTTPFYFGETITTVLANYNGYGIYGSAPIGEYRQQTTDVGTFPPNAFGLYDMHGNVWEWCQDYWHENYQGAPTDGSAWLTGGDSTLRILRGSSWNLDPGYCRAANRYRNPPIERYDFVGFRVVMVA